MWRSFKPVPPRLSVKSPFLRFAGFSALLILAAGCKHSGDAGKKAAVGRAASDSTIAFHATPLDSIPPKVPPLEKYDWLYRHFAWTIPAQGAAPKSWPEIEKEIRPEACGTCHAQQYQDWKNSFHHQAMGPGVLGQLLDMERDAPVLSTSCQRCHAPLAEQVPYLEKGKPNPDYREGFREQGLVCAACHVRNHEHFGPDLGIKPNPKGPHGGFTPRPEYLNPAFCAECHDFKPGGGVHGKMLLETAEEWRRTDFAAEGKTCQSCHMPDGRHLWKGIHDPEMVRSAVSIEAGFALSGDSLRATLTLTNTGAGHRLPTYNVPQILLIWEQFDATGAALPGTREEGIIARVVTEEVDHEFFDTRLFPGESFALPYRHPLHPLAVKAMARVEVWPDEGYRKYFQRMLETPGLKPQVAEGVEKIRRARELSSASRYVLWRKEFALKNP